MTLFLLSCFWQAGKPSARLSECTGLPESSLGVYRRSIIILVSCFIGSQKHRPSYHTTGRPFRFSHIYEKSLVMRKPFFCICENKDADQPPGNRKADQRLCFRYIVQSLFFLNPKFQASNHLVWLSCLVCVGPGGKPRRPVFSQRGSKGGFLTMWLI